MTFALPFDWPMLYFIQAHLRLSWLDTLVPAYSALGNGGHLWIAIAVVLLVTRRYRRVGVCMLVGMMAGVLIGNEWLKNLVARPRPFMLDSSVALLIPPPGQYSFPSGHTLSSFIAAGCMLFGGGWLLGSVGLTLATLMGLSRLYLFVHFPSDILAAVVLGLVIAYVVWHLSMHLSSAINAHRQ